MKTMVNRDSLSEALGALRDLYRRVGGVRVAAAGGAAFLALAVAIGAGAAPSPVAPLSEVLGLGGAHGDAVSQAVHEAQAAAREDDDGSGLGPAVSEAACTAAHDRSTLPNAEEVDAEDDEAEDDETSQASKDCTHPSNAESESEDEEDAAEDEEAVDGEEEFANHGEAVSQAVHDAKASLEDGEKVGPAVSEAACEAAHDRNTLPQGAQDAPGQDKERPPKDCTHPSNADSDDGEPEESAESEAAGGSGGHGKDSAPGQLKKQQN
jgi:hypothetical protein